MPTVELTKQARKFTLAKMSPVFTITTWALPAFSIGLLAVILSVLLRLRSRENIFYFVCLCVAGVCGFLSAYFSRPKAFEISPSGLTIRWLGREGHLIQADKICSVRIVVEDELGSIRQFRAPWAPWGLLGKWCWAERLGRVEGYITRKDVLVLIELHSRRPLLITPESPEEFVEAMLAILPQAANS